MTPAITEVKKWKNHCEAKWTPALMPFKYKVAPILAYNLGRSQFHLVEQVARAAKRPTVESGLSSKVRARAKPLPLKLAREVIAVYERLRAEVAAFGLRIEVGVLGCRCRTRLQIPTATAKSLIEDTLSELEREVDGAEGGLHTQVRPPKMHAKSRCGRSRCRRSNRRSRRCT